MEYVIATTEIPGELWKVHSKHDTEESALAAVGEDGTFILEVEMTELSVITKWRWDESGHCWTRAEWE